MWTKERKRDEMEGMKRNEGIHRHDISDEVWERIKDLLPGQAGKCGGAAQRGRCARALRGETCRQNLGTGTACTSGFAAGGTKEYGKHRRTPQ
jgi:hypothetical protein